MLPTVRVKFHPLETVFPNNDGNTVECTYFRSTFTYPNLQYDTLEYRFSYTENIGEGCFFACPRSTLCGYHPGDSERVIMLLRDNIVEHVYFKAHDLGQGMWLPWDRCHKDSDGNLIAHVARGSHAFYPEPETYIRIFGFANDQCSDRGRVMTTNVTGEHNGPYVPKQRSITPTQRFFLPFVLHHIENGP